MSVYLNNGGAGTYGGQVWADGLDANDGLSRSAPLLTANVALDQYNAAGEDGNDLIIAPGSYTYTNGAGRIIFGHASLNIQPDVDWSVKITFDGTAVQGMRFAGDAAEARTNTVGKIYITTNNAAKLQQVDFNSSLAARMTVNWSARIVPQGGLSSEIGMFIRAVNHDITINDGGTVGSTMSDAGEYEDFGATGNYAPITMQAIAFTNSDITINKWICNARIPLVNTTGIVYLFLAASITGDWVVSGITGTFINSSTAASTSGIVKLRNSPDGAIIEGNNNLNYQTDSLNHGADGFAIESPVASAVTSTGCIIRNNKNVVIYSGSGAGLGYIIGNEGSDSDTPDGWIYGNELRVSVGSATSYHGISHIGCTGGLRFMNTVIGAMSIGSLTKLAQAVSFRNIYKDITGKVLYAKGGETGTGFVGENISIKSSYASIVMQAGEDPSQLSVDVEFKDILLTMPTGVLAAGAKIGQIGTPATTIIVDGSTGTFTGILLDDSVDVSALTTVASDYDTDYATIAAWEASTLAEAIIQNADVSSFAAGVGISGLAYSTKYGIINADLLIDI